MAYIQHNNPFKKKYNSPTKGTWDTMSGTEEGEASFHSYMKGYHGLDKEARKSKFKTDFEEAVSQRITKSNPLPRLIENFTNNEARAWKAFGDALGIDFTPDGQLVRRPVLSTQQINKKYKNFNVNQMELALDKITPENRPEFILRMKLARGKTMRKQPSSPSEFGQDDFD